MSHEQFKSYLQRDKLFLKELYESNSVAKSKNLLSFANDSQLTTLIKYIHFVANGEIKINKKNFDSLRKDKIKILLKLVASFSDLLAPLFVE